MAPIEWIDARLTGDGIEGATGLRAERGRTVVETAATVLLVVGACLIDKTSGVIFLSDYQV